MIFCTVTSNKHLFLAKVMAKSIKETHTGAKVVMCLVEQDFSYAFEHLGPIGHTGVFDHIVLAKDLGFPNFFRHMFKQIDGEGPISCKARLLQYVFKMYPDEEKFIYIDSDMRVYNRFEEVDLILDNYPIILTPHLLKPIDQDFQPYPTMLTSHFLWPEEIEFEQNKNGIYNSGFLALRRTDESVSFLNWWARKLDEMCYIDINKGIFGDQRWLDLAPVLFKAYILKHPGYNAAWWNHSERNLSISDDGHYIVNGLPLCCFHFSIMLILGKGYPDFIKERFPDPNDPIHDLVRNYIHELIESGQNFEEVNVPWSYSYFQSGDLISPNSRLNFRNNLEKFSDIQNPFQLSNQFFAKEKGHQKENVLAKKRERRQMINKRKRMINKRKLMMIKRKKMINKRKRMINKRTTINNKNKMNSKRTKNKTRKK